MELKAGDKVKPKCSECSVGSRFGCDYNGDKEFEVIGMGALLLEEEEDVDFENPVTLEGGGYARRYCPRPSLTPLPAEETYHGRVPLQEVKTKEQAEAWVGEEVEYVGTNSQYQGKRVKLKGLYLDDFTERRFTIEGGSLIPPVKNLRPLQDEGREGSVPAEKIEETTIPETIDLICSDCGLSSGRLDVSPPPHPHQWSCLCGTQNIIHFKDGKPDSQEMVPKKPPVKIEMKVGDFGSEFVKALVKPAIRAAIQGILEKGREGANPIVDQRTREQAIEDLRDDWEHPSTYAPPKGKKGKYPTIHEETDPYEDFMNSFEDPKGV
jgi:hypothetical protein